MRLALAIWNGRISPLFDVARRVLLIDIHEGRVVARSEAPLAGGDPAAIGRDLARLKVEILVCGAVSRGLAALLAGPGIRIIPFVAGDAEEVISAYLAGALPQPALAMPGCRCGRGRALPGRLLEDGKTARRCDMPRGDGTGPLGKGPGTGRGRNKGRCGASGPGVGAAPGADAPQGGATPGAGPRKGGGGGRGGKGPQGRGKGPSGS